MLHILRQISKTGIKTEAAPSADLDRIVVARLQEEVLRTLGRALTIRQVDAGSCNGCELEIHALGNPYYNIEGLGTKLVVAVGDCGCTGGIFGESYATLGRVSNVIPVDVEIPGCPPTPTALLQGILAAITTQSAPREPHIGATPLPE